MLFPSEKQLRIRPSCYVYQSKRKTNCVSATKQTHLGKTNQKALSEPPLETFGYFLSISLR